MTDFKHGVWYPISQYENDDVLFDRGVFVTDGKCVGPGYFDDNGHWTYYDYPDFYNGYSITPTHFMVYPNPPEDL